MTDKKRVLFVDDEEFLLEGLRRMLRNYRNDWEMVFTSSGQHALACMAEKPFDVVVSDMRMPSMSGAELLKAVQRQYPSTVRLVLSGQADKDDILTSVGPIHQFLQKPCDLDALVSAVNRTCELGRLFKDVELRSMITELESLPSLSTLHEELLLKLNSEDASALDVGESIGRDIGMTTKILQLVNSSFFGLSRSISTPSDAVLLLGMDTVRSLIIAMQVFSQVSGQIVDGFSEASLVKHSVSVATIAKQIALHEGMSKKEAENVYLAGLLHDVGKLVLATRKPDQYAQVLSMVRDGVLTEDEAEHKFVGATHGEIGGFLLCLWAFSDAIVDSTIFHHVPSHHNSDCFSELTAVHVANAMVNSRSQSDDTTIEGVDMEYLSKLGLADRPAIWKTVPRAAA